MKFLRSFCLGGVCAVLMLSLNACSTDGGEPGRSDSDQQTVWGSRTKPGAKPINGPEQNGVGF